MEETYQETVITGQNAQTTYNATVEDLKETLQEAEETKEKREEQLQAFEDFVGSDGILYAAEDGVITGVGYEPPPEPYFPMRRQMICGSLWMCPRRILWICR